MKFFFTANVEDCFQELNADYSFTEVVVESSFSITGIYYGVSSSGFESAGIYLPFDYVQNAVKIMGKRLSDTNLKLDGECYMEFKDQDSQTNRIEFAFVDSKPDVAEDPDAGCKLELFGWCVCVNSFLALFFWMWCYGWNLF